MSFSKILASSLMLSNGEIVRSPRSFPTREIEQDRRYFQLIEFMKFYNIEFDERKYWTYGCNCHVLGDRPMSDPGFGPPVDKLDSVCKQYKDCNKCAREKYGDACIGELVQYQYGHTNKNGLKCQDDANTCERALCECDAQFARDHAKAEEVFDLKYHSFYASENGGSWVARDECPQSGGAPHDPQCCTNSDSTKPFQIYNAHQKECCANGSISPKGQCS